MKIVANSNDDGNMNSKLISNVSFSIFFLIVIPISIWFFLSIPRIYFSIVESNFETQFTTSYINLNLNFTYILLSFLVLTWNFSRKLSKYLFLSLLIILFIIRSFDFGLKNNFGISYSSIVFKNLS